MPLKDGYILPLWSYYAINISMWPKQLNRLVAIAIFRSAS